MIAGLVRRLGTLDREARRRGRPEDGYGALVRTITGQQLSTKAAKSIYARLTDLYDGQTPSPESILGTSEEHLRGCGLSRPKVSYLRDLARRTVEGEMRFHEMPEMSDGEVIARLTAVKGLGRWSADMFLMFHLGRPDILPVGDLGVRRAIERNFRLPELPAPAEMEELAAPWRPHRTLASFYLWESLDMGNPVPGSVG
ncbi:MAG: DNA-3-methyladenine glycosylase family protein [Rubrobacter sp.]